MAATSKKKRDNLPIICENWEDEPAYKPPTFGISMYCLNYEKEWWAWQFLRRNEEYQRDFFRALGPFLDKRRNWYKNNGKDAYSDRYGAQAIKPENRSFTIESNECRKRWGLNSYLHPKCRLPRNLGFESSTPLIFGNASDALSYEEEHKEGGLPKGYLVRFEHSIPIEYQIERLIAYYLDLKGDALQARAMFPQVNAPADLDIIFNKPPGLHQKEWPKWLRAYDARMDKQSYKNIAKNVLDWKEDDERSPEEMANHALRMAKRLINSDYLKALWVK